MIKKLTATVFLIASLFLVSGAQAQEETKIPNLKGTWESTAQMHSMKDGHSKSEGKTGKIEVLSQEGRVFHGIVSWNNKKNVGKDTFSGVIDKDETTFYVAGHTEGTRIGKMEGADAFTLYIMIPGGKNPKAGFAEFTRVK